MNTEEKKLLPQVIKENLSIEDCTYIESWTFENGHKVPIYQVDTVDGLNQIIGHVKFNNRDYGKVFYRGQGDLHPTMRPGLTRGIKRIETPYKKLKDKIFSYTQNEKFCNEIKIDTYQEKDKSFFGRRDKSIRDFAVLEAIAQQYGEKTRFLDVVDNHWNALWFGLHKYQKSSNGYSFYTNRVNLTDSLEPTSKYQYLILLAVDDKGNGSFKGFTQGDILSVDLRMILPSTFLRPHAQHSLMVRRNKATDNDEMFDLSGQVVGILRLHIDKVNKWLGNGQLMNTSTIFPSPRRDFGYDLLLKKEKEGGIIPLTLDYFF